MDTTNCDTKLFNVFLGSPDKFLKNNQIGGRGQSTEIPSAGGHCRTLIEKGERESDQRVVSTEIPSAGGHCRNVIDIRQGKDKL